jgi:hypothetical protein
MRYSPSVCSSLLTLILSTSRAPVSALALNSEPSLTTPNLSAVAAGISTTLSVIARATPFTLTPSSTFTCAPSSTMSSLAVIAAMSLIIPEAGVSPSASLPMIFSIPSTLASLLVLYLLSSARTSAADSPPVKELIKSVTSSLV